MRRLVFALALTLGLLAACTLIDPLDDVSAEAGKPRPDSGAGPPPRPGDDDDDDVTDAGADTSASSPPLVFGEDEFSCDGFLEREPNNSGGQANPLPSGKVCAKLTGGSADVDVYRYAYTNKTGTYEVEVTGAAATIAMELVDTGGEAKKVVLRNSQDFEGQISGSGYLQLTVSVTGTTDVVPYKINVTLPP
ncbi:MAG: hypothetical protein KIT84_29515 [Labilithrix sp.]|nr:hypothetical protein [Labilithrix sp.]MCW5815202.1 hypothetical protein [Labilithrix sp.]